MANPYFASNYFAVDKDQKLAESLVSEMIYNHGLAVKYLPRELVDFDSIYGEDPSSNFDTFYSVDAYVKNVNGFQGDGNFLAKFGIEIRDEITFSISRTHFTTQVLAHESEMSRPREGDLIAVPSIIDKRKRLFEITFVNQEENFYQFGSLYTWEIRCKTFEMAGEQFSTGDVDIDSIMSTKLFTKLAMSNGNSIQFIPGEEFTVDNTSTRGNVQSWSGSNLVIENVTGNILQGQNITGTQSGAKWNISSIVETALSPQTLSDTQQIKQEANGFLLFDESNPFSEM